MSGDLGLVTLAAFCLLFSAFMAGMEAGLFALNRLRVRHLMHRGNARAGLLHEFLQDPEDFLWTITIGNTLANFSLAVLSVYLLHTWLGGQPWLLAAGLAVLLFFLYVVGDLLPKLLFRQFPERLCLAMAYPFRLAHLALAPLVAILSWLARQILKWSGGHRFTGRLFANREEMRMVMQESAKALTSDEQAMVNRVLDLQHVRVGQLMVPMERVATMEKPLPIAEMLRVCAEKNLSRFPVREAAGGRVVGVVSLHHVLYRPENDPRQTVGEFLQPALFLDDSQRLEVALQRMQRAGQRLAMVLGRDGDEIGILTLEDILRFLFGEFKL